MKSLGKEQIISVSGVDRGKTTLATAILKSLMASEAIVESKQEYEMNFYQTQSLKLYRQPILNFNKQYNVRRNF